MFSKQEILAALRQLQSEMPETITTSEPLPGYSGGSQEAPIIVQQQSVPERSAARENNVVDTQGIRYVVVDEMAVKEKPAEVGQAGSLEELLQSAGLEEYTHTLQNDHGITSVQMFAEMEKEDVNLFCQVISHRIQFRKLLVELVISSNLRYKLGISLIFFFCRRTNPSLIFRR